MGAARAGGDVSRVLKDHWSEGDVARELPTQRAMQRGWIKGRDECWKAEDLAACVADDYRRRAVELQIVSGQLVAPDDVSYACEGDEGAVFSVTYYQDTDPPSAVTTRGDDQVIAFRAPSGSGARYTAADVELWEHQGEAAVTWFRRRAEVPGAVAQDRGSGPGGTWRPDVGYRPSSITRLRTVGASARRTA